MVSITGVQDVVTGALADGRISGAVVLVSKDGTVVHADARGTMEPEVDFALEQDTVFWLASLSKAVCAAAVTALVDDGRMALDDPLSRFIPEFANPGTIRVLAPDSPPVVRSGPFALPPHPAPVYTMVPSMRPLLVRDVLTHTSGLQSMGHYNSAYSGPSIHDTLKSYVPTLAGVPRDFQPGTQWAYSNAAAFEITARAVEVASGMRYDKFVHQRFLDPLGMRDTGFGRANAPRAMPAAASVNNPVIAGDNFFSAAAGLWGSAGDYLIFLETLQNRGVHQGQRMLSPAGVQTMSTNQVDNLCPGLNARTPTGGIGFGLAVAIITDADAADTPLTAGTYGWDGMTTRRFWVDPTHGWSTFMYIADQGVQREVEAALASALN